MSLRGKVHGPGVVRQQQSAGALRCRHSALCAKSRRRFDSGTMKARHGTKSVRMKAEHRTAVRMAQAARGSVAVTRLFADSRVRLKRESSACSDLCCYLFLFQLSLERIGPRFMLGDAEMAAADAAENGNRECSEQFLVLSGRQRGSAAQQWLLLLEPFSLVAAAAKWARELRE